MSLLVQHSTYPPWDPLIPEKSPTSTVCVSTIHGACIYYISTIYKVRVSAATRPQPPTSPRYVGLLYTVRVSTIYLLYIRYVCVLSLYAVCVSTAKVLYIRCVYCKGLVLRCVAEDLLQQSSVCLLQRSSATVCSRRPSATIFCMSTAKVFCYSRHTVEDLCR